MEWTWGWAAVLVALIAAGFAGWQAYEARKARTDAGAAQKAAEEAAVTAASAQAQSADSLAAIAQIVKEQHESARAAAARKPDPWRIEGGRYVKTGDTRVLALGGDEDLVDVELKFDPKPAMLHLEPSDVPTTWRPGDSIEVYWVHYGGGPRSFTMEVHWRREGDAERTVSRTTLR